MAEQKIIYEPHPVSPERKAELRKAGLTIIDLRFRPDDVVAQIKPTPGLTRTDVARMSKAKLVDELTARGLEAGGFGDDMRARLAEALF